METLDQLACWCADFTNACLGRGYSKQEARALLRNRFPDRSRALDAVADRPEFKNLLFCHIIAHDEELIAMSPHLDHDGRMARLISAGY
jgi:hypothetical protein